MEITVVNPNAKPVTVAIQEKSAINVTQLGPTLIVSPVNMLSITSIIDSYGEFDKNYVHAQVSASTTWTVNHGLNKRCSIVVVDSLGEIMHGETTYQSNNTISVVFSHAVTGSAYCN
jgi:hypothetical protein